MSGLEMEETSAERFILVLEDDPEHVRLITTVLQDCSLSYRIEAIANGAEALDFLHRRGTYAGAPRPALILLNLNLPGLDGQTILADIKSDRELKRIPVIVLTTSMEDDDIFSTYALQGNCYVIKASQIEQLAETIKRIETFWLRIVTLPGV